MQTGAFLTATGTTVGTPTYMAPEQAMAQDIGPWTDLYSVGCMAFELFTGSVPFHDSDAPMAILLRHVNEPIAAGEVDRPDGRPARSRTGSRRCWSRSPTQRTQNAQRRVGRVRGDRASALLGPRWRREARLVERRPSSADDAEAADAGAVRGHERRPATPAPRSSSRAWGAPADGGGAAPVRSTFGPPATRAVAAPEPEPEETALTVPAACRRRPLVETYVAAPAAASAGEAAPAPPPPPRTGARPTPNPSPRAGAPSRARPRPGRRARPPTGDAAGAVAPGLTAAAAEPRRAGAPAGMPAGSSPDRGRGRCRGRLLG